MKYLKVIVDIFKHYSNILTYKERNELKNILIEIKDLKDEEISDKNINIINRILNIIWDNTLTDINKYKDGDDFCFLIKKSVPLLDFNQEPDSTLDEFFLDSQTYTIFDNNSILNADINECGVIVKLHYNENERKEPLLPIYFKDRLKLSINEEIIGYYHIDSNLERYDISRDTIIERSIDNNKTFINFNKSLYRLKNNYLPFTDYDAETIVEYIFLDYNNMMENVYSTDLRDLVKKEDKETINFYLLKYYKGIIDEDTLIYNIYDLFEAKTNNLTRNVKK